MKNYLSQFRNVVILCAVLCFYTLAGAQTYRSVNNWSSDVNNRLESFLNSTLIIQERKVAVFDCDGTLFGQVPHYLADEALYEFAKTHYDGKKDNLSSHKMEVILNNKSHQLED